MDFSDTTNKDGLIQLCETYTNLGDGGISGDATQLKKFTMYINKAGKHIWSWIFEAYGGWQYEDGNQTDLPSATQNLVSGTATYALPSDALTIRGIEIKDSGGVWNEVHPITLEEIKEREAEGEFYDTDGIPVYYRPVGNTIELYPASNYNSTGGFRVLFGRGSVGFTSTDTTETAGFASEFHEALAVGGSLEWLKVFKSNEAVTEQLRADWVDYERRIKSFYEKRWLDRNPPRMNVRDYSREMV